MANFQNLQQKVFFEAKTILDTLSKVSSHDELMSKHDLFSELADRISFLKILEKNEASFTEDLAVETIENQNLSLDEKLEILAENQVDLDDLNLDEDNIEEEVIYTNEINEIDDAGKEFESLSSSPDFETEHFEEMVVEAAQEVAYEDRVAQKEEEITELEARRRQIVEFDKRDSNLTEEEHNEKTEAQRNTEKKFKLAHIKGLKAMQDLFGEDPLDKLHEAERESAETPPKPGSILKSNIPTDYMEAERKRTEFRLDLNDKVAFTKILFKGHEEELTKTIAQLNSYDNIEDARQYLSELYYEKDWKKADEYAQRLWNLVENKFM